MRINISPVMHNLTQMPIGISDFATIRRKGLVYIDKTKFVHVLEGLSPHSFVIRPHGFGRSLMVSMLEAYYDIKRRDEWESLFGGLEIAQNPTSERSSYLVAHLDFGSISGNLSTLRDEIFSIYMNEAHRFYENYAQYLPAEAGKGIDEVFGGTPADMFKYLVAQCHANNHKVYIFVDNYDCLVECVLRQGGHVSSDDKAQIEGLKAYFSFFDLVKNNTMCNVDKFFAVGVVPISIKMAFPGVDLGDFDFDTPEINGMMGFDESDVLSVLKCLASTNTLDDSIEDLIVELRHHAGGYCFSRDCVRQPRLFSPQKLFSFVKAYSEYGFNYPVSTFGCDVCPLLSIRDVEYDTKTSELKEPFGIDDIMVNIENIIPIDHIVESRYFLSLLYYFGLLTIVGHKWGTPLLNVPNESARAQMKEFLNY